MNIKESRKKIETLRNKMLPAHYLDAEWGISIIIPVHAGMPYIDRCLSSLVEQNIDDAQFEVVMVFNGQYEKEIDYLFNNSNYYSELDITVLISEVAGAGAARNLGVKYARYSHISFLDIDDYLSEDFIQKNYDMLEKDTIVFSQIHDVYEDETIVDNPVNNEILKCADNANIEYRDVNRILTITACKAIPRSFFSIHTFNEQLKSGEDTVFFTQMIVNLRPKLTIIPLEDAAIYFREVRKDSVSRKADTYDFLITQRMDILKILEPMLDQVQSKSLRRMIFSKYNAQIVFMNKYLKNNKKDHPKILSEIKSSKLNHFNYSILNRDLAETLVLSYCFAPFNDTSATIVGKRILEKEEIMDVVSNNMNLIRSKDNSFKEILDPYLAETYMSKSQPSFNNFYYISKYVDESYEFYSRNQERYKNVYSRAMFPASHIPPLFIKISNPDVYWKAEFSDPLLFDIESNIRESEVKADALMDYLQSGILNDFTRYVDNNLFNLAEIIPFALADELIFTNENQMNYMISRFDEKLQEEIMKKATIKRHPTLDKEYYEVKQSNYEVDDAFVNVAYFGNFYSRRDMKEILSVKKYLEKNKNVNYKFHIFTNINTLTPEQIQTMGDKDIVINNYIPYLEFLNVSKKFDILLVFDSFTKKDKPYNPYLPSKVSDYLGSGSIILAATEENSILDQMVEENLYHLNLENIEESSVDLNSILDKVFMSKGEYVKKSGNKTIIFSKNYEIEVDESMNLERELDYWQVQPSTSPISLDKDYSVKFINKINVPIKLEVKSFYPKKDIIDFNEKNEAGENTYCITNLSSGKNIIVPPFSTFSFSLNYNKPYKNPSFLKAGRLAFRLL